MIEIEFSQPYSSFFYLNLAEIRKNEVKMNWCLYTDLIPDIRYHLDAMQ
jgi:hypothetical protein